MEDLYYNKYIKYKIKYQILYEEMYGGDLKSNAKTLNNDLDKYIRKNNSLIILINQLIMDGFKEKKDEIINLEKKIKKRIPNIILELKKNLTTFFDIIMKNNKYQDYRNDITEINELITNLEYYNGQFTNLDQITEKIKNITIKDRRFFSNNKKKLNNIKNSIVIMNGINNKLKEIKRLNLINPIDKNNCLNIEENVQFILTE